MASRPGLSRLGRGRGEGRILESGVFVGFCVVFGRGAPKFPKLFGGLKDPYEGGGSLERTGLKHRLLGHLKVSFLLVG